MIACIFGMDSGLNITYLLYINQYLLNVQCAPNAEIITKNKKKDKRYTLYILTAKWEKIKL